MDESTGPSAERAGKEAASRSLVRRLQQQDALNFWLTNRIPRVLLSRAMGRFSRIRSPLLTRWSIRIWRLFADDLRLHESPARSYESLQECFTRELLPGTRPIRGGPGALTSPCDAVVGAHGTVADGVLLQAKGMVYRLDELLGDGQLARRLAGCAYVTLRLKSSMYHRFHAPCAGRIRDVAHLSGDAFNVNPPALARIPGLFCRNERAVISLEPDRPHPARTVTLVPVAAVLVSSMRFAFLGDRPGGARRQPGRTRCDVHVPQGGELGWFEHGSTIIVIAGPGLSLARGVETGNIIRMGESLLVPRLPARSSMSPTTGR